MKTRVVNLHFEKCDVPIHRGTKWGNPFHIGKDGTRTEVIEKFFGYLLTRPDLLDAMESELKGRVLGCWCWPLDCHGDVYVGFLEPGG